MRTVTDQTLVEFDDSEQGSDSAPVWVRLTWSEVVLEFSFDESWQAEIKDCLERFGAYALCGSDTPDIGFRLAEIMED